MLEVNGKFEVIHPPECNILFFRYVGGGTASNEELDALNLRLRTEYKYAGLAGSRAPDGTIAELERTASQLENL